MGWGPMPSIRMRSPACLKSRTPAAFDPLIVHLAEPGWIDRVASDFPALCDGSPSVSGPGL